MTTIQASPADGLIGSNGADLLAKKFTLASGENVVRGTVLGQISSGGKLNKSLSAAGDGSQTPFCIAAEAADGTDGDVEVLAYIRGTFNENALILGTGHTVASIREGLRDRGIFLETSVKRNPA